ncbi:outer membrane protein assembly factor BamB family protein [Halomonas sp. 328]|uniref:outer membrane protein assembly factor BamB family protein n=1 Tax=Halomonas sp. 328 TaxID=2776704 RepID=UPI0018A73309|nr:PQQ-binding-like beta-propeller repeat protein [Halomonas sp. 328]MBF8224520.1 PQQ-binding-like beta-propeller repeat protein [Halomonas sp. 328]
MITEKHASLHVSMALRLFTILMLLMVSSLAAADSVMFQANLERTGVYHDAGPEEEPTLVWKFDAGAPVVSTPLVYDGMVYFVDFEEGIYALNQNDGSPIWEIDLGGQPSFEITVNEDLLLVGRRFSRDDDESYLMAIDRLTGEERWKFETDDRSGMDSPTIYNNMVFLVSMSSHLFSLSIDSGEEVWRLPIQGGRGQPLISNTSLYLQDASQTIYSFSPDSGEVVWSHRPSSTTGRYSSTPAIDDCFIYAMELRDEYNSIVKINKHNGEQVAEFPIEFRSSSSISLTDGIAFFGDDGDGHAGAHGYMNAMDAESGELIWRFETEGFVRGAAAIAGDTVYFGSGDHHLYAVDRHTGEMRWRYETGAGITSTPAIVDGRVYFGSIDGHVYVLE